MRLLGYRIYYYCWKTFLLTSFHASRLPRTMHQARTFERPLKACRFGPSQDQPSARGRAPLRRCA